MPRKNLVALGTAAVLAIYAAGFDRTRAAAQRWADEDIARRPSPPSKPTGEVATIRAQDSSNAVAAKAQEIKPERAAAPRAAKTQTQHDTTAPVERTASAAIDSTTKNDTASQADSSRGPYKDGTYYGWGTSRHGDIQAGIEISNGRITAAWIEKCLTQYSCSWIDVLPGQVEKRQSADVDFVSGATQSTSAFYHGVVQALSQAK